MKSATLLITLFFFSICAQARMSYNTILSKIDSGANISWVRAPMQTLDGPNVTMEQKEEFINNAVKLESLRDSNFKPSMWYYHAITENDVIHMIFYQWREKRCTYTFLETGGKKFIKGSDVTQIKEVNGVIQDSHAVTIPVRYCEKLYNFYEKK